MDNDRWHRVDQLLQSALDTPAAQRDAYLRDACGGDEVLEREVRSLLVAHDRADGFLDGPAIDRAARDLAGTGSGEGASAGADRLIGHTFSHYRIVERIGAGGMGVLYKAEDTRLGRPVALKFVSDELSRNHEAVERFAREARLASSLNHPNICTIYDIGEQDVHSFIVMEYLEGTTLRDRLAAGALTLNAALDVGVQLAAALDAAHTAGIIHRDIKPANIFLGPRDHVKVLDFGLAKTGTVTAHADVTTIAGTRQGVVMGTAAYMAPEQARGEVVDHRADLWSVGLVLYEMVKGARPAQAVRLRIDASPELERIVSKCLESERELRYQHASELRTDLERLKRGSDSAATAVQPAPVTARARWIGAATAGALIAIAVAGYIFYPRQASALTEKDTIVLAEFTNTTGDPVFDDTLRQGLAAQIQQSPFLSLVSDERIRRTLPLMNEAPDARLTPEVARVVCVRTGGAAVLQGSIAALGSQYVLGLRATSCATGDILADEQAQASQKEEVLNTLSQMVTRFRTRVGESLATVEEYSTPLQVTTPSLEALQAYSAGMKAALAGSGRAVALFERAVEIDPEFALAHAHVGFRYGGLGESARARQSLRKAYELRHRASDAERLYIETLYNRDYTGNMEQERRILETWAGSYPRDPSAPTLLAGLALSSTGQYEAAIAETEKALAMDGHHTPAYANRANNQIRLNRLDDAMATVNRAAERKLENASLLLIPYFVAFLKGDEDAMTRAAAEVRKGRGEEDNLSHLEGMVLARSGRLTDARRAATMAVELAQRANRRERAGLFEAGRAVWESFYGNASAARESAARALELGKDGREVRYAAAFALALSGDLPRTRSLADALGREFPEDTFVQYMYLPTLRALVALDARDPKRALDALQPASRYDLALGAVGYNGRFGGLHSIYVRGLTHLAAHQPSEAVGEFQRILDHPGIVLVDPMGAMARLQLARALALAGDHVKAKRAYEDLFTLWKNADPDVPVVKQARAEYARLP